MVQKSTCKTENISVPQELYAKAQKIVAESDGKWASAQQFIAEALQEKMASELLVADCSQTIAELAKLPVSEQYKKLAELAKGNSQGGRQ